MSEALGMMMMVGVLGIIPFIQFLPEAKWAKYALGIWLLIWCFPPLAALWIKGVFV